MDAIVRDSENVERSERNLALTGDSADAFGGGDWGGGWDTGPQEHKQETQEQKRQESPPVNSEKNIQSLFDQNSEDDDEDDEDIKIDEALKSAGANLWNWVSGS